MEVAQPHMNSALPWCTCVTFYLGLLNPAAGLVWGVPYQLWIHILETQFGLYSNGSSLTYGHGFKQWTPSWKYSGENRFIVLFRHYLRPPDTYLWAPGTYLRPPDTYLRWPSLTYDQLTLTYDHLTLTSNPPTLTFDQLTLIYDQLWCHVVPCVAQLEPIHNTPAMLVYVHFVAFFLFCCGFH